MKRGRPVMQPSRRNLELYHELVCEGRLQAELAARFRISQPRVAQLRRQMAAWVEQTLPADLAELARKGPPGDGGLSQEGLRLHLAIGLLRFRLEQTFGPYLEHFGGAAGAASYRHMLAALDAGIVPKRIKPALPQRGLMQIVVRLGRELEDLARVAQRGPLLAFPDLLRLRLEQPKQEQATQAQALPTAT